MAVVAATLSAAQVPAAVAGTHRPRASRAPLAAAAVPTLAPTLVQTILTSRWSPASPDPSGVVYLPDKQRLEICDSEVDEKTGAGYHGVNMWETRLDGTVTDTGTTLPYSREPTGLGYDASTRTLFISDDDLRRIWMVTRGSDGTYGTGDDGVSSIDVGKYGSTDVEDPEFDPATGHLFFLDGKATEVFDIDPVDGKFGNANDSVTHFDVGVFGPRDFEGLASDQDRGTLLVGARKALKIYEVTKTGTLVRIIDAKGIAGLTHISGLKMAPASDGSGRLDYWITDRGVDNGSNSSENDGKLFELALSTGSTNSPPSVTNPGAMSNLVGDPVSYQIQASDPDAGDTISSYGASGLPPGLSVSSATGLISGTLTTAGTFPVTISATDNHGATGTASFTWTVSPGSGSVVTVSPVADAFVASDTPDSNFGGRVVLKARTSPSKDSLLKFTVSGVGAVSAASLRLYVVDGAAAGGDVYRVGDGSWGEKTVTWNNAPAPDPTALGSIGPAVAGTWVELDVSPAVTGDGTYTFRILGTSTDLVEYTAREGTAGFAPQLVLTIA